MFDFSKEPMVEEALEETIERIPASTAPGAKGRTMSDKLYQRLRGDITDGIWKPGAKLRLDELRAHYAVGLSPLREAMMRLASEGLTILEGQRGFHVSPISRAELIDITMLRQELETLALRLSIKHGGDEWEANLLAAFHRLSKLQRQSPTNPLVVNHQWEEKHRDFHFSLVAACGSPLLLQFRGVLYDRGQRYRSLSIAAGGSMRDDLKEHRQLLEATLTRNEALATQLMCEHFARTQELLLDAGSELFE